MPISKLDPMRVALCAILAITACDEGPRVPAGQGPNGPGGNRPPPTSGPCGNGALNGLEPCDGAVFAQSQACAGYGLGQGNVTCNASCQLDFASCSFDDYCTANNLYNNGECDSCDLLGGVRDPDCETVCGADGTCADRYDPLTNQWTCLRLSMRDPDCGMCGNGIIEGNELCDGSTFPQGKHRCQDWGYLDGDISCKSDCSPNFNGCRASACGDGMIEGPEQCDGTQLNSQSCESQGFAGGMLTCTATCGFARSGCIAPGCNNNILEPALGEACDGGNLNNATCENQGFAGGSISCDGTCQLDTSMCVSPGCGNTIIEPPLEECEGMNLNGASCESKGFLQGTLQCSGSSCTYDTSMCIEPGCGNNIIEAGSEQCEGANLNGATCMSLGFLQGDVSCNSSCQYDTSMCVAAGCGNTIIEPPTEQCEGANLNNATCITEGFIGGDLSCNGSCRFDTSMCTQPRCGDGMIHGNEQCDGMNLNGATCSSQGLSHGDISCDRNCNLVTTLCVGCGNNRARGLETCDGTNFSFGQCSDLGLGSGSAVCTSECRYDVSQCSGLTMDLCAQAEAYTNGRCDPCHLLGGMVDPECTAGCGANGQCVTYFEALYSDYTCALATGFDDPDCGCGDRVLSPLNAMDRTVELCDGSNFVSGLDTCADWLLFGGGTLGCDNNCLPTFDNCNP